MYGCPPDGAPAPMLNPATPTDLLHLRGHARREIAAIRNQIATSPHPRDVAFRPLLNRLATWERIEAMTAALLDSAQLTTRVDVPQTIGERFRSGTFWLGVAYGMVGAVLLGLLP